MKQVPTGVVSKYKRRMKVVVNLLAVIFAFYIMHSEFSYPLPLERPLYTVYASEATSSADLIKQKIEQLKADIASKAAKIKDELSKKLQNKLILGQVNSIANTNLTVNSADGNHNVITNQYTIIMKDGSPRKLDLSSIKKDNYLTILGDIDDKSAMNAKKIIIGDKPQFQDRVILSGTIVHNDGTNLQLETVANTVLTFTLNKDVSVNAFSGQPTEKDLTGGLNVIIVAIKDDKHPDKMNVRFVQVIGKKRLKPSPTPTANSKIATPSGSKK